MPICHYILWCNFSEVLRSFAHINRLYCFLQQAFEHMYLDLDSGELKFQGLFFHVQCFESPHQNFQELARITASAKTRSLTFVLAVNAPLVIRWKEGWKSNGLDMIIGKVSLTSVQQSSLLALVFQSWGSAFPWCPQVLCWCRGSSSSCWGSRLAGRRQSQAESQTVGQLQGMVCFL